MLLNKIHINTFNILFYSKGFLGNFLVYYQNHVMLKNANFYGISHLLLTYQRTLSNFDSFIIEHTTLVISHDVMTQNNNDVIGHDVDLNFIHSIIVSSVILNYIVYVSNFIVVWAGYLISGRITEHYSRKNIINIFNYNKIRVNFYACFSIHMFFFTFACL